MWNLLRWMLLGMGCLAHAGSATETANAAEGCATSRPAATTTQSAVYNGWVHVQAKNLQTDAAEDPLHDEDSEYPEMSPPEFYMNPAEELLCTVVDFGDRKIVRLLAPGQAKMSEYDSKFGGVAFGTMPPTLIQKARRDITKYPLTVDAHIALLEEGGATLVGRNETIENALCKVTVVYVGGKRCVTNPDANSDAGNIDLLWIDPKTQLIQKLVFQDDHPQEITFTYDNKPRKDIYDFGVPRDAKIIDSLPTPKAARLLDRFDKRNDAGFGNFVGVITETDQRKEWGTRKMFLYLYAQEDQKLLYAIFDFSTEYPNSPMNDLANWPNVDIKQVLELARTTVPLTYYATDGTTAWMGRFDNNKDNPSRMREGQLPIKDLPPVHDFFAINEFWKNRHAMFLYGYGPRADTVTDADHAGLIGLRLREGDFTPTAKNTAREERVYWVDPARNDLPIHFVHRGERISSKPDSLTQFDTRFLEFAKLTNGTWYPTHWKTVATRDDFAAKTKGTFTREKHLKIDAAMKIDAHWYGSWAKRLGVQPEELVFKNSGKK